MAIDYQRVLGNQVKIKAFEGVPQQEIYLEIFEVDGNGRRHVEDKICLDEIPQMSTQVLLGFKQYVIGQMLAMDNAIEGFWENPERDTTSEMDNRGLSKLRFKRKIHALFSREIEQEVLFRREASMAYGEPETGPNHAEWLRKYHLPVDEETFSKKLQAGRGVASKIAHVIGRLKREVGEERYHKVLGKNLATFPSGLELQENAFAVYLASRSRKEVAKAGWCKPATESSGQS